ncbi:fucolectin-like [Mytilus californianus]|uniref:fucolectin-like n=1 Tax=Mytilus californianus TaxID=6549 RepID=UPI0022463F21|nr:fucolectin-like [Mytilus californianus]
MIQDSVMEILIVVGSLLSLYTLSSGCHITISSNNGEDFKKCDYLNIKKLMDFVNSTITKQTQILQDLLVKNCQGRRMDKCVEDVAHKKPTGQSSTLSSSAKFNSSQGVDGLMPSGNEYMIHTKPEKNPFWWVNLGREYLVERVEIWNRKDCCAERTRNMDVTVGPILNEMKLCAHYKGPSQKGEHLVIGCTKRMRGRYVKLQIQGTVALNLLEVKVFAFKTCSN